MGLAPRPALEPVMDSTTSARFHPESVRFPLRGEILRLALVASAGFYHSPVNSYERPQRDRYPKDTVHSYRQELISYLSRPECILVVVDDECEKSEDTELYPALKKEYGGRHWAKQDGKVIVGFACMTLKRGSHRVGKFQPDGDPSDLPDEGENPNRDQSREGVDKLASTMGPHLDKHLGGEFSVDMIAVHPTYWRRGHGTSLLMWAARLADEDQVSLGIASVPMAIHISRNVGFQEREVVEVEGYSQHPESLTIWIAVRECGPLPSIPKPEIPISWTRWALQGVSSMFWRRDGPTTKS